MNECWLDCKLIYAQARRAKLKQDCSSPKEHLSVVGTSKLLRQHLARFRQVWLRLQSKVAFDIASSRFFRGFSSLGYVFSYRGV